MAERHTKTDSVLKHLQLRGSITAWEAIELYKATRLSGIIFNLKKKYLIRSEWCDGVDSYGNHSRWTKYIYLGVRQMPQT